MEDSKGKRELLKVSADETFYIDVEYYEELELHTAVEYAAFPDKEMCAVSVNEFGAGKAYYVAAESNTVLLKWLVNRLIPVLGLKRGLSVPEGIQAREIAPGQRFYVNVTNKPLTVPLERPGKGVLTEKEYRDNMVLRPYDAELVVG